MSFYYFLCYRITVAAFQDALIIPWLAVICVIVVIFISAVAAVLCYVTCDGDTCDAITMLFWSFVEASASLRDALLPTWQRPRVSYCLLEGERLLCAPFQQAAWLLVCIVARLGRRLGSKSTTSKPARFPILFKLRELWCSLWQDNNCCFPFLF